MKTGDFPRWYIAIHKSLTANALQMSLGTILLRYAMFNPLREIATEAFHNWHQVQILEAEMGSAFIQ